jgi:hypothetical protein
LGLPDWPLVQAMFIQSYVFITVALLQHIGSVLLTLLGPFCHVPIGP